MASAIGKVRAVFTASTSGLTSGVNQASASMKRLQTDVRGMRSSLSALTAINGAQLFGSIASGASQAVGSLVRMGQAQADVIDRTSKLAARLGMTYGELSGIAYAGDLAGVSMDQIAMAATKADVAFVNAANGSKEAIADFERLGLSVEQLSGLTAAERFRAIADAISGIPDPAQRAAAAVGIFGRSGAELLPLFSQGAGAIGEAAAEAQRLGLSLTNMQGQNVEAMNDSFTRVQAAINGVVQQVVAYLAPAVEAINSAFVEMVGSIGGANIGQAIGEGILTGAEYLASVVDAFLPTMQQVWEGLAGAFEIGQRVFLFAYGVAKFFQSAFLVVQSIFNSIIGRLLNAAGELAQLATFGNYGKDTEKTGEAMMANAKTQWSEAGKAFSTSVQAVTESLSSKSGKEYGQAAAGPLESLVKKSREKAKEAASQIDVAVRSSASAGQSLGESAASAIEAAGPAVKVDAASIKEAIQGADSRTSEGVKQMFDIMRGRGDVQQQQLQALNVIADNTADIAPADFEVADLPAAAGA